MQVADDQTMTVRCRSLHQHQGPLMPANRPDLAPIFIALLMLCITSSLTGCTRPMREVSVGTMAAVLPPQPDLCGLVGLGGMIGQEFVGLADQPLVGNLRVIWPGQEITSDIVPSRLNAQVSNQGLILDLRCG